MTGRNEHHVRMIVQDDGRGFDTERVMNTQNPREGFGTDQL